MGLPTDVSQPAVCCWTKFCFSFILVMPATIILQPLLLTKRNKYAKIYS